ncbi:MAG: glycosyltransferase [Marinilabiliaceae bacterium]
MSQFNLLFILAVAALLIITWRWLTALINLITGKPAPEASQNKTGDVSVLIPARNEAKTLPRLFKSLTFCDATIGEILVYNDQSEDETAEVVRLWSQKDSRIRIIEGKELPEGWTGKNHACHQLAHEARSPFLLFLDADVEAGQEAIERALSQMKKDRLALFSFFPVQEMHTTGEWLLVAQVNIILVSLLPLALSHRLPLQLLTAANGQFMMFDASKYRSHQFHEKVSSKPVEDVAIARYLKKTGEKYLTALAPESLKCRMYHNYGEALHGLSRSARFFFGGSILTGWIYVLFSILGWLPVLLSMPLIWLGVYFSLLVMVRIFVSVASHQPVVRNIILMPAQQAALFHLFLKATQQLIKQKTSWKGRTI